MRKNSLATQVAYNERVIQVRGKYRLLIAGLALCACIETCIAWYLLAPHCQFERQTAAISGGSLEPAIKDGSHHLLLKGYYECRALRRNDLVAFRYGGSQNPLVKIARGLPGDSLALEAAGGGLWHILLNGEILRNTLGAPYVVDGREKILLDLYINDYHGVIPADAYLFLGNLAVGSKDSRDFGLVSKSDVIGKVV